MANRLTDQAGNPFHWIRFSRGVSWRWDSAYDRAASPDSGPPDRLGDDLTSAIYKVLVAELWKNESAPDVDDQFLSELKQIRAIYDDAVQRLSLEARVLARLPLNTIAKRCNLELKVVALYEKVFFDIREQLDASSFVMARAVGGTGRTTDPLRDVVLKPSYFGGPLVAEHIIGHLPYLEQDHDLATKVGRERERLAVNVLWARIHAGDVEIKSYAQLKEIRHQSQPQDFSTISELFEHEVDINGFAHVHEFGNSVSVRDNELQVKDVAA